MKQLNRKQSGFTLVEIAIVLVIIGLLLGGVLKGQEMIENSKIKNLKNDIQGVSAAYYAYRDRYNAAPGDDLNATAANRGWAGSVAGDGNNVVGNNNGWVACAAATAGENCLFWRHLRHSGLLNGALNNADPANAYGGAIRITQSTGATTGAATGFNVCVGNLPAKAAEALEAGLDDGAAATGTVRVRQGAGNITPYGAAAVGFVEPNTFTTCRAI